MHCGDALQESCPEGSAMTTIVSERVTCAHCGAVNEVCLIASTSAFGPMDLDMRSPPPARHTLGQQIRQCQACLFCSPDLANAQGVDRGPVGSAPYRLLLEDAAFPPLARRFRAYGHLAEAGGNMQRSAWSSLRAAWVCDDAGLDHAAAAISCRTRTLQALDRLHAQGQAFCADRQTDEILRLDLLRRAGRFDEVLDAVAGLQAGTLPPTLACIARYQARLAGSADRARHTVDDALPDVPAVAIVQREPTTLRSRLRVRLRALFSHGVKS
jgi:hypothetical protein